MYEERIAMAGELHKQGYNCCQSVVAAFADLYGFSQEQAFRMSAAYGGGLGRLNGPCGAVLGLFMLAGLETGTTLPKDPNGQKATFDLVQELAEEFKKRNGAIGCKDLLQLPKAPTKETPNPDANGQYYFRPCNSKVMVAATIWCEWLDKHRQQNQ